MGWGGWMIGVDTNIVIRLLLDNPSGPEQAQVARRLVAAADQPLLVAVPVIAEIAWVARGVFRLGKDEVISVLSALLANPAFIVAEHVAVQQALDAYRTSRADFTDHLIAALNRAAGCTATLTFDKIAAKGPDFTLLN